MLIPQILNGLLPAIIPFSTTIDSTNKRGFFFLMLTYRVALKSVSSHHNELNQNEGHSPPVCNTPQLIRVTECHHITDKGRQLNPDSPAGQCPGQQLQQPVFEMLFRIHLQGCG